MPNKNTLEYVFDCLYHEQTTHIPKALSKARADYRSLVRDLTTADKRKLNYITSLLDYCEQERWPQAKSLLEPAEQEYRRHFLDGVETTPKPGIVELHSKRLDDAPDKTASGKKKDKRVEFNGDVNQSPMLQEETSLVGVHTADQIADKFGEIHKNEWKAALYELEQLRIDENKGISCLLSIVMDAYKACVIEAENQITKLEDAAYSILMEGFSNYPNPKAKGNKKHLIAYRRGIADICVERIQESFRRRFLPEIIRKVGVYQNVRTHGPVNLYVNQCITICWKMVVLDPQVHMVDDRASVDLFKHDRYKHFGTNKSSNTVLHYVWPALLRHKDGPLLVKGIAQGK